MFAVMDEKGLCEHCGKEFVPGTLWHRYCSDAHKVAAYRLRKLGGNLRKSSVNLRKLGVNLRKSGGNLRKSGGNLRKQLIDDRECIVCQKTIPFGGKLGEVFEAFGHRCKVCLECYKKGTSTNGE